MQTEHLFLSSRQMCRHLVAMLFAFAAVVSPFAARAEKANVFFIHGANVSEQDGRASEIVKAQQPAGDAGEVSYFRGEQGLEVDIVLSPREGCAVLAECKMFATVTPDMIMPMRRLAASLGREDVNLISRCEKGAIGPRFKISCIPTAFGFVI